MKIQKKLIVTVFILLSSLSVLSADSPSMKDGVNFTDRSLNFIEDSSSLSLIPSFIGKAIVERDIRAFEPSGVVEVLYTMPLPDTGGQDMLLHILQSISAVSSLQGIEYWSGSRQSMYPYLEEAYAVEKRKSNKRIDDPVFNTLPVGPQTFAVYQNDTTFGKAWYDVTYEVTGDAIRLSMVNTTTIRYKFFPVLRDENLRIELVIVPGKKELLFYGLAAFKLGNTFGIQLHLDQSFDHRMSAFQIWFSNQTYH